MTFVFMDYMVSYSRDNRLWLVQGGPPESYPHVRFLFRTFSECKTEMERRERFRR